MTNYNKLSLKSEKKLSNNESPLLTYKEASVRFRVAYQHYREYRETVILETKSMFDALKAAGYKNRQAINKIQEDHKDLKGFSKTTVYKNLPDEVKAITKPKKIPKNVEFGNLHEEKTSKSLGNIEPRYVEGIENDSSTVEESSGQEPVKIDSAEIEDSQESPTVVSIPQVTIKSEANTESLSPAQESQVRSPDSVEETPFLAEKFGVDDFDIDKLNTYSLTYCRKVIRYFSEYQLVSFRDIVKLDKRVHERAIEIRNLQNENATLRKELEEFKGIAKEVADSPEAGITIPTDKPKKRSVVIKNE